MLSIVPPADILSRPENQKILKGIRTLLLNLIDLATSLRSRMRAETCIYNHRLPVVATGAAIVSTALAPFIVPLILGTIGFGFKGVVTGTAAAAIQSTIGNVAAGSLFATCQSVAAGTALPLVGFLVSAGLGAIATTVVETLSQAAAKLMKRLVMVDGEHIRLMMMSLHDPTKAMRTVTSEWAHIQRAINLIGNKMDGIKGKL
jgi:hypothetical protein